ncbi:MAG TPA: sodium transporter [Candidatus Marinimicrobia bacterium]|nr:sodium transporter [Candidatus Neomarinimicrobiota bacterium]
MKLNISYFDFVVIFLYFGVVMFIGFYFSKHKNSEDYFLAGRDIGWLAIGASLFASNISSEHFIGLAGSGASSGLAVGHFEWLASFIVLFLGWVFVPFYLKSGVFTMPEFLEKRYNRSSRVYLTTVSIVAYVITKISVTLLAGGLLLNKILGWDMISSAIVLVVITGIYTIAGGLKAVIYTELMQAVVLIGGAVMLTVLGMNEVGGWAGLREALPADYFSMFKPSSHADFPWTGILFGAPILGIWYWCTDQFIVQRVLAAKNINHARSGAIFAGFLKILPVFILVLPGLVAAVLFPGIEGDEAYPMLVTSHLLPIGIKGIVIAALLAALMSSLASVFNSSSTLFTMDFYKNIKPSASENELVLVGRLATTVLVILGILWVPLIRSVSSQLFVYLQSVQGYISPPIAAVFLFGIFWKRANGRGAIYALVGGGILGAARLIMEILTKRSGLDFGILDWYATMNFLHFATMLFVISAAILLLVSLLSEAPARVKIAGLTFTTADEIQSDYIRKIEERNPRWTQINIGLSILLVMSILTLWGIFF